MFEANDLIALRELDRDNDHDCHSGGRATTGLGFGIAGLAVAVVGIGASFLYANAKSCAAMQVANLNANNIAMLNNTLLNEMNARQLGDTQARNEYTSAASRLDDKITITNNAATSANAAATSWANAQTQLATGVLDGQYRHCPDEVTLVSKQYCPCPASNPCGCGCNG